MVDLSPYPTIIFGNNRLKGRSHFTEERFGWMIVRAFRNHDRIVIESNYKTEDLAEKIINILGESFKIEKDKRIIKKKIENEERDVIRFVIQKIPALID